MNFLSDNFNGNNTVLICLEWYAFLSLHPEKEIVSTLSRQLSWSHLILLCTIEDDLKRDFYTQMCRIERWGVRTLKNKLNGMLFEHTALSKKPDHVIQQKLQHLKETDELSPDLVFHDPCFLHFTGLKESYSESDLETAISARLDVNCLRKTFNQHINLILASLMPK